MAEAKRINQDTEKELELVVYKDLTPAELRGSNYPNSKLGAVLTHGVNKNTGYEYSVGFIIDHPNAPYLKVDTEKRKDFLKKGSEREAEDALKEVAFAMRSKTGGYFDIHPFYGAIFGTHFNPITDFCKGREDENLSTIVHLTNNGRKFDSGLTNEAVSMGTVIAFPGPNAQRFMDYTERVNRKNPNQRNRGQAMANGLGEEWDAEFEKYNPQEKRQGLMARIFSGKEQSGIPTAMDLTQNKVAGFIDYLQEELGFTDLKVTQTNYKGLSLVEFRASTLPKEKVSGVFDKNYNHQPHLE